MATREELLALLLSRRRGLSIRPLMPGHSDDWNRWLADDSRLQAAQSPELEALVAQMSGRPLRSPPRVPASASRWAQFRALFKQGWGDEGKEPRGLHYGALTASLLLNFLFAALLVWLMYLRFLALQAPEEETVRIQITGFGTPETGGGGEPAQGDVQPADAAAASAQANRAASASTSTPAAATPSPAAPAAPAEADQPLQVSENKVPEQSDFQLPPAREVAIRPPATVPLRTVPVPSESEIPEALPEVRAVAVPTRPQVVQVPVLQPAERELTTPPEPAPQVRIRDVQARATGTALSVPQVAAGRALPTKQGDGDAASTSSQAATGGASRTPSSTTPGLPGASGQAPKPGQSAAGSGVGPAPRTAAQGGWPSPRRDDDWGAGNSNRAGAAAGGDRGNPRGQGGQGGSGLFNPDGSPRLADDSFKPRFPDPYKEGTWLKRPSLGYRGTMFDGIWQPPETLLQEWVRKGVKTIDIPLPGGKVKIRCVVSLLAVGGGCGPIAGKEGVHDQPASARPPPAVPFKPHLIENQSDLTPPPAVSGKPASKETDEEAKPATQP